MKRYGIIISVFIILILVTSIFFHVSKKDIKLDNVKIKKNIKNNMFAMYKETNEGYVEITNTNEFPSEGYKLNLDNSKCMDNFGSIIPNILSYNDTTKKVVVDTDKSVFCYLYFSYDYINITLISTIGTLENNVIQVLNGNQISLPSPTLDNNDYYFEGWYFDSSFTNKVESSYIFSSNISLYANWKEVKTFIWSHRVPAGSNGDVNFDVTLPVSIDKMIKFDYYSYRSSDGNYSNNSFSTNQILDTIKNNGYARYNFIGIDELRDYYLKAWMPRRSNGYFDGSITLYYYE